MPQLTTVGQLLVNDALPEELRDYERTLSKDDADKLLQEVARKYPDKYKDITWKLMQLGREASFLEGTTLRLSDLAAPFDKSDIIAHVDQQERKIKADKVMSPVEKEQALGLVYSEVQNMINKQTLDQGIARGNPFAMQVKSKARGNPSQLAALMSTPSVYQDAADRTIPVFIRKSYAEGLDPHEYWAATYGARKGIISTKFATRDAGYLGKQLGMAVSNLVVTKGDCETITGIPVNSSDPDNIGAVLARPTGDFPAGTVINKELLADLQKRKQDEIVVRSPVTCSLPEGVCKICVGHREDGKFPEIGHHVGLNAASALAERIAQSNLNAKHSGGQGNKGETMYAGFDVIEQLAQVPKVFPHRAALADKDGTVDAVDEAPQGGYNVMIDGELHYVAPELTLTVKKGDVVEAGDELSSGIVNPADAVRYRGLGEGRRYFADRFTQAFRDSKYPVNRRNVEVLSRAMVNHVSVDEPEGIGNYLPGDVVHYNALSHGYKPRLDSKNRELKSAIGEYLEQPVLHYSIGTKVTLRMADRLKKFGIEHGITNARPAGFTPSMVSLVKVPEHEKDWMARLGTNYLESRLLDDVHRGAKSNVHGLNPLPGIAKGTEFGESKGKGFTF